MSPKQTFNWAKVMPDYALVAGAYTAASFNPAGRDESKAHNAHEQLPMNTSAQPLTIPA